MAKKKKGGLIDRLLMGKEKSEGYARASLPSNRWELFWDIFKGRFWKLVLINLLTLLFFIPLIALIFFRYTAIINFGSIAPFTQGFGVGFGSTGSLAGYSEAITFNVNLTIFIFLPITVMIAMVGIAGAAYVIRNMVWTEGIFVSNDFWRGIKQNIKQLLVIGLIYSLLFYVAILSCSLIDQMVATDTGVTWLLITAKVISISMLVLISIMTLHMVTMCVTYELSLSKLIKNAFLFTIGLIPHNIFFIFLGALPFLLMLLGGFFQSIALILILLFGFSLFLLIWTDFCQWAYDMFINDKVPGAQKNRGIYEKVKESDSEALKKYREQIALNAHSALTSRPIKPITDEEIVIAELPTSFSRSDIEKLNESKRAMIEDHERYVEEHKNDEAYKPTEEEAALQAEKLEREKRIEKAKKELSKRKK